MYTTCLKMFLKEVSCNTVGELTWLFCVWSQLLRIVRVATDFSFIQKRKGWKEHERPFEMFSWVSTLFIRNYLRDLSCLLDHLLFVWMCLWCGFWKYFENVFVMALVSIRTRTKCCFENISKRCLWNVFLKVILKRCLCNGSHFYNNACKVF